MMNTPLTYASCDLLKHIELPAASRLLVKTTPLASCSLLGQSNKRSGMSAWPSHKKYGGRSLLVCAVKTASPHALSVRRPPVHSFKKKI